MWRSAAAASVLLFLAIARAFHTRPHRAPLWRSISKKFTAPRLLSTKQAWDDPDYKPPTQGQGEWADWDSDGYMGDMEPEMEDGEEGEGKKEEDKVVDMESKASVSGRSFADWKSGGGDVEVGSLQGWDNLMKTGPSGSAGGRSASENWAGWSEDAPYFDDNDILDEEPVKEGSVFPPLGSSDLWARPTSSIEVPAASAAVASTAVAASAPPPSSASTSTPAVSSLPLEMGLEARVLALQGQVSDLKSMVALLLGLVVGYGLGSGSSPTY